MNTKPYIEIERPRGAGSLRAAASPATHERYREALVVTAAALLPESERMICRTI